MADIFRTLIAAGGGNYTSFSSWEADTDYNLVTSGTKEIGLVSGSIAFNSQALQDATTDSQFYRVLTHATGNKHTGTSGAAVAQFLLDSDSYQLDLFENFARVSGLYFNGNGKGAFQCIACQNSGVVVDSCVFSYYKQKAISIRAGASLRLTNNIFYKIGQTVIDVAGTTSNFNISNNTLFNCGWNNGGADDAIIYQSANGVSYICNNVSVGSSGYFDWQSGPGSSGNIFLSGNCSSDARAPGFQKQSGLIPANLFVSADYGPAPNLTIKGTSSSLYNSGVALEFAFTTDASGTTRPQATLWDCGAFEFVAGGVAPPTPPATPIFYGRHIFVANNQPDSIPTSGFYDIRNGILVIPVRDTLPNVPNNSSFLFIKPSGKLAYYNGTSWLLKALS